MNRNKPKRGGARPGAGRKPLDLGEKQLNELIKAFKKEGKAHNSSAGQELAKLAFTSNNERIRLKALDVYYRAVAIRKSHSTIDVNKPQGPKIFLPEVRKPEPDEIVEIPQVH
jgi:hypothetical protein